MWWAKAYHGDIEAIVIPSVGLHHYETSVQTKCDESESDALEHPQHAHHHGSSHGNFTHGGVIVAMAG